MNKSIFSAAVAVATIVVATWSVSGGVTENAVSIARNAAAIAGNATAIAELRNDMRNGFQELRDDIRESRNDMRESRNDTRNDIQELRNLLVAHISGHVHSSQDVAKTNGSESEKPSTSYPAKAPNENKSVDGESNKEK